MATPSLDDVLPLHLARVTFPEHHPLRGQSGDVFGFAVRSREGLVLFDTGVGAGDPVVDQHYQPERWSLEDALAGHGHRLDDVALIVNSHLHFDHCGNNPLFPGVPIHAQRSELEASREKWYTVPAWVDFDGVDYRAADGDVALSDSMRIVATPGHTTGHQSLVLDTPAGCVVLAGQAIYSKAEYDFLRTHGTIPDDAPPDPAQYVASARELMSLQPRRVHFSHDAAVWMAD